MIGIADKNDPQILDFAEKNKALSPVFSSGGNFDVYWTAQRVIESDCFKVFTAFCGGRLAGYIDVRLPQKLGFSEPFDLKVSEEHLGEGLEEALLKSAITYLKTPMFMMTEGCGAELSALKAAGFAPKPETDNVTYHIVL